eukprot:TRINITY_DN15666_c0_g1_i1.p1 TRINITY_DN15666_c0_g1~~TRINITY_DN15666_c0_g1_i1.p1  ORF type:complete len:1005 (-),score=210.98 TRINITY_DN15666_c0_g1_i1:69-3026(-)
MAQFNRVSVDAEIPSECDGLVLAWTLSKCDATLCSGAFRVGQAWAQPLLPDLPLAAGTSLELKACLNVDEIISDEPSFGDYFVRLEIMVDRADVLFAIPSSSWKRRTVSSPDAMLTVYYHRFEGDYDQCTLWTWDEAHLHTPTQHELSAVGRDDFGLIFQLDLTQYNDGSVQTGRIGLLPRQHRSWADKDSGGDRFYAIAASQHHQQHPRIVYLVQGNSCIHETMPDVSPKIKSASLDAPHHITLRFTHGQLSENIMAQDMCRVTEYRGENSCGRVAGDCSMSDLLVESQEQLNELVKSTRAMTVVAVHAFEHSGTTCKVFSVQLFERIRADCRYVVEMNGFEPVVARNGCLLKSPDFFTAQGLGARYSSKCTTFRLFAPAARCVALVISASASTQHSADNKHNDRSGFVGRQLMRAVGGGLWALELVGDLLGVWYSYQLCGTGHDCHEEIADPYAVCTQGRHLARCLIVDLSATDPAGFRTTPCPVVRSMTDVVLYELHVRDFTQHASSGVTHKGLYAGLTESGTVLQHSGAIVSTGLDHLVELGITHVQLMPVQHFHRSGSEYSWGYMPLHYFSPDGWYASSDVGSAKITELKRAIQTLHAKGIGVCLDVVYNHFAKMSPLQKVVDGYYVRHGTDGEVSDGSGCGNEFDSAVPMARKLLIDSVTFWAREYMIDGFRFDLMGLLDKETMLMIRQVMDDIRPGILLYGEPWAGGLAAIPQLTDKEQIRGTGIAAFNDHFRNAIKGTPDATGDDPTSRGQFIQTGQNSVGVMNGLRGSIDDWAAEPSDTINYFEAHDNLTTWDHLLLSAADHSEQLRVRMIKLAHLTLLIAQGVAFLHSGQEFCRSKHGCSNSYNQPDEINALDWTLKHRHADVFEYVRALIAIRKAHPCLRLRTQLDVQGRVLALPVTADQLGLLVCCVDADGIPNESITTALVLLNGANCDRQFSLPCGGWNVYANEIEASVTPLGVCSGSIVVPPHSGLLLMQ